MKKLEKLIELLLEEEKIGAQIVLLAIKEPVKQIALNAGHNGEEIIKVLLDKNQKDFGWNALTNKFVNMIEAGIIDPTKVVRSALQNAASVAATLLTTESIVAEIPENIKKISTPTELGNMGMY